MFSPQENKVDSQNSSNDKGYTSPPPAVSLPKGGGAIKGIGEKFAVNPVTGTGSLSVPIFTTPSRSDFYPQLSLSYDSGAGNGVFGLGWNLSVPSITRKTDKGLPRYFDGEDSDVFILSGAEDLVPVLVWDQDKELWGEKPFDQTEGTETYTVRRYRPRIEGLFARIERWQHRDGSIHWRSLSKDNVTSIYGRSKELNSQIVDPTDESKVFKWLLEASYDDRGNLIVYEYKKENADGQDESVPQESHRLADDYKYANVYLKRIWYGNRTPYKQTGGDVWPENRDINDYLDIINNSSKLDDWLFQMVFDYGEHGIDNATLQDSKKSGLDEGNWHGLKPEDLKTDNPTPDELEGQSWLHRPDAFSTYRAGFEIRTQRLCRRVLMFHRMNEAGVLEFDESVDPHQPIWHLVRSTDFGYEKNLVATYLVAAKQTGYVREAKGYLRRWMPPLEMHYDRPKIHQEIQTVEPDSVENLPMGLDGSQYQWVDLDSEGISGILTEQGTGWFYKRNLGGAQFGPAELVATKPSVARLQSPQQRVMDLAGDGTQDIVLLGELTGYYQREADGDWLNFRSFESVPNVDWNDPNLRFLDLNGDGHADILITQDELFVWYPSQAREGFGASERVHKAQDEEKGPALVFADGTQSIYLADMSGDGLNDLLRIRNGEVCYWPSMGYGRFGAKITMNNAPHFDHPEMFDQKRVRLADIDGSGTTDILYLGREEIGIWLNQAGNGFRCYGNEVGEMPLTQFPTVDDLAAVQAIDLLGNGTACLVWSSPLPGQGHQPMQYIDLMGGQKPHLMTSVVNNLGAETKLQYSSSTKFYLEDRKKGNPWITRLPFPVHVVERVETIDHLTGNRFVSLYRYRHGYFDGEEREFRGFGFVEQWDTEAYAELAKGNLFAAGTNEEESSHVPPVYTKTWFHTGAFIDREHLSTYFAQTEYYREPRHRISEDISETERQRIEAEFKTMLLPDTLLPDGILLPDGTGLEHTLTAQEEREACRALKGSVLRQEVYAWDEATESEHPYTVSEQNYELKCLQPRQTKQYAVFFAHPRETLEYHYERHPKDPRISHEMTLEVDGFGNVLKSVAIAYPHRKPISGNDTRYDEQKQTLITYNENQVTNKPNEVDWYRIGLPIETRTYEITGLMVTDLTSFKPFTLDYIRTQFQTIETRLQEDNPQPKPEIDYHEFPDGSLQRRLVEQVRTLYRSNSEAYGLDPKGYQLNLIPPRQAMPTTGKSVVMLAKIGGFYHVRIFDRAGKQVVDKDKNEFLSDPALRQLLEEAFKNPRIDVPVPSKWELIQKVTTTIGYTQPNPLLLGEVDSLALPYESYKLAFTSDLLSTVYQGKITSADLQALLTSGEGGYKDLDADGNFWIPSGHQVFAPAKFYLPTEFIDPFGGHFKTEYDDYALLVKKTEDALPSPQTNIVQIINDYRVMQPKLITDPNGNRSEVAFDALGMVVGTAVMGKEGEKKGDSLEKFQADLDEAKLRKHLNDPLKDADQILGKATTRLVYDLWAYYRTKQKTAEGEEQGQPTVVYTLARETHDSDLAGAKPTIQHSFLYSDGFGREIQTKIQAEEGKAPQRDANVELDSGYQLPGELILENDKLKHEDTKHRWVGTGRTIYNNKGKPVRQYEPFFSSTHLYEQEQELVEWGVTPIIHYDPLERVIHTDLPNGTFSKVEFDPWQQTTWDENDTVKESLWYEERKDSKLAKQVIEAQKRDTQGTKYGTPTTAHLDVLGRAFLTIEDNGIVKTEDNGIVKGERQLYQTHVQLDIEGNQLSIRDNRNNLPMVNGILKKDANEKIERDGQDNPVLTARTFDLLSNNLYSLSMDAGERWTLNNVAGNPIRLWDGRQQQFSFTYDALQRPTHRYVQRGNGAKILIERTVYGEFHPDSTANDSKLNLRGQVYKQYDGAGIVTNKEFDFKGNLLSSSRQLRKFTEETKQIVDWGRVEQNPNADVSDLMEQEIFTSKTAYDALNRPTSIISPHVPNQIPPSEIKPTYNEANLLEKIDVRLRGSNNWSPFVLNINYNAKGQRELIQYAIKDKNNDFDENNYIETKYKYDPKTFRLIQLKTTRTTDNKKLQDFNYTYDPVGNITEIEDKSQQTIIFNGTVVPPNNQYEYDALYRLTKAKGREHLGQTGGSLNRPVPTSDTDVPRVNLPHPGNGQAMGRYLQEYVYDAVGNILEMNHTGTDPRQPGWRRCYQYALDSNRLLSTGYQSDPQVACHVENHYADASVYPDHYGYDSHGNMDQMPHLTLMKWDCDDQLQASSTQAVNNDRTPETTYYFYDASGQRVRKVTERKAEAGQQPTRLKERIYLNGFEIYRKYDGRGATVTLERETLHIMDDEQRIALVETKTKDQQGNDRLPKQLTRYQLGNHLGSVSLELDDKARIISYEEYYPYGSTSYQAVDNQRETPKRYRFTGKERDQESRLYYHGARYYVPWLGRWCSSEPTGFTDGINVFNYAQNNPIISFDPDGLKSKSVHLIFFGGGVSNEDFMANYWAARNLVGDTKSQVDTKFIAISPATTTKGKGKRKKTVKGKHQLFKSQKKFSKNNIKVNLSEISNARDMVDVINKQNESSIKQLDIVAHGGPNAIKLSSTPKRMAGVSLITSEKARIRDPELRKTKLISGYSTLDKIDLRKFSNDARIELHACRTAEGGSNIAQAMSQKLSKAGKTKAVVIAHPTKSNPNIIKGRKMRYEEQDYRHLKRRVYYRGELLFETTNKGRIPEKVIRDAIENSQTPPLPSFSWEGLLEASHRLSMVSPKLEMPSLSSGALSNVSTKLDIPLLSSGIRIGDPRLR